MLTEGYRKCEQAVIDQCRELLERRLEYAAQDGESFLDAAQNARLIASAERYYRIMYYGGADPGICATRTCSKHSGICLRRTDRGPRPWSGRITPTSAMPATPKWASFVKN